jgi:hypothetical protein
LFDLAPDIEKYTGKQVNKKDAEKYAETVSDAYIYGLSNVMNGGNDIYLFINGTRFLYEIGQVDILSASLRIGAHEAFHLTEIIANKNIIGKDWLTADWLPVGWNKDMINAEIFADAMELVIGEVGSVLSRWLKMT